MTIPILIQSTDGQFCASVVGSSDLRCVRPSREEALGALRSELTRRVAANELVDLEIQPLGVSGLAGQFHDDPALRDICEQIYQERDAQNPQ